MRAENQQQTVINQRPRIIRILAIDQQIRDHKYPNAGNLSREFKVTPRSIHRDIDYMQMEYDAPIAYNRREKGYYYENPDWKFLLSTTLNDEQIQALILARQLFAAYEGTPLFDKASEALKLMVNNGLPLDEDGSIYSFEHSQPKYFFPKIFAHIEDAIRYRNTIDVVLLDSFRNGIWDNPFDPYLLYYARSKSAWYFLGLCHKSGMIKVIGLHRIKMATLTREHFEIPRDFSASPYLEDAFRDEDRGGKHIVRLHFSMQAAGVLRNFPMVHRRQEMDTLPDGSVLLFFATNDLDPVKEWLEEFGPCFGKDLRILAPDELLGMVPPELRDQGPYPDRFRPNGMER